MQDWTKNLIVISILFVLSLLGSFVLFYFLDSSGQGKYKNISIEGALAGFVVIYLILASTFYRLLKVRKSRFEVEYNLVPEPGKKFNFIDPTAYYQIGKSQKKKAKLTKVYNDYKIRINELSADDDVTIWVEDAESNWRTDTVRSSVRHLALHINNGTNSL